ncbi:fatty acid desaturase-domain-containing protein [Gautieria morchelliformis]|nr:fatty acid desaturase-domain-containing protein [Gautieria morchelliformis]
MYSHRRARPLQDLSSDDNIPEYVPMQWSQRDIRNAIPSRLFVRDTKLALMYTARDLAIAALLWYGATFIDPTFRESQRLRSVLHPAGAEMARWGLWCAYWWFQGLTFTGMWVIGHECGHNSFSPCRALCNAVGYIFHTALWTPYFSWKFSHHRHHSHHASMEKDEFYVPSTRSELGIPSRNRGSIDYEEYFGDTPIYTMFKLLRQQLLGFPVYLLTNASGQKNYPRWTNHFNPRAILFSSCQRNAIILSDIGIFFMAWLVTYTSSIFGTTSVVKYYGIPWLAVTHWVTMITYLQHTDPQLPRYRKAAWTFSRGAASTVDRDFLGWQGRFFFHDVAHYHVIHHYFPQMPFYHGEEATAYLKAFIGDHYKHSNAPVFSKLWENYNFCQFVEDDDDVVFFKNRQGKAARRPATRYRTRVHRAAAAS